LSAVWRNCSGDFLIFFGMGRDYDVARATDITVSELTIRETREYPYNGGRHFVGCVQSGGIHAGRRAGAGRDAAPAARASQ
jgi:hypothetical protein